MLIEPANVISQLDQDVADQTWASTTMAANHSKRKLGATKLPENPAETISLAQTQATILTKLFGKKCTLAYYLQEAARVLTTLS